jgi:hypothetical protein
MSSPELPANELSLQIATQYLTLHNWRLERSDDRRQVWISPEGRTVLLPNVPTPDLGSRLSDAMRVVAAEEERNPADVQIDLEFPSWDRFSIRSRIGSSNPALPVDEAIELQSAVKDLISAAARSSVEPKSFYLGGPPQIVHDYIDRVLSIPPARGSYILQTLLPMGSADDGLQLPYREPSFERVTRKIATALDVAVAAAELWQESAEPGPFEQGVESGLSANLLEAMIRLTGSEDPHSFEARIGWSTGQPLDVPTRVVVKSEYVPALAAGASWLRGGPKEISERFTGVVVRLKRQGSNQSSGEVTVRGLSTQLGERTLTMELDAHTYDLAIEAHRQGTVIEIDMDVQIEANRVTVLRVRSFVASNTTG